MILITSVYVMILWSAVEHIVAKILVEDTSSFPHIEEGKMSKTSITVKRFELDR